MIFCDVKIKVQISLFINKFSLDPLFVYIFSMAAFVLQRPNGIALKEIMYSANLWCLLFRPLHKKFANLCFSTA